MRLLTDHIQLGRARTLAFRRLIPILSIAFTSLTVIAADDVPAREATEAREFSGLRFHLPTSKYWQLEPSDIPDRLTLVYNDPPGATTPHLTATMCVYRVVVPESIRAAAVVELANAFVLSDVSGAMRSFYGSTPRIALHSDTPEAVKSGSLLTYLDGSDKRFGTRKSTQHNRVYVLVPSTFAADGILLIAATREDSRKLRYRPTVLEEMREILVTAVPVEDPNGQTPDS